MLNILIGNAINLVDVNISETKFNNIKQLESFLKPLVNIKRLSIYWPQVTEAEASICCSLLEKPFSRLTYLSLQLLVSIDNVLPVLPLCQELEVLHISANGDYASGVLETSWGLQAKKLKNLKIIQVCGWETTFINQNRIISMLPVDQRWTNFLLIDGTCDQGFYFEKSVEVCKELEKTKMMEIESISYSYLNQVDPLSLYVISENLLREVIRITHEDVPETFCCLTPEAPRELEYVELQTCLLKIDEAKQLLKNPRYQISFLQFKHSIETDCDAHLITSAFPNLTVLILADIIKGEETVLTPRTKKHFRRCLRRRGSMALEEQNGPTNLDSSFKILVQNTPHMRDLTICGNEYHPVGLEKWDLDALNLISRWKNLTILRLKQIPLIDGNFLIKIGQECPQLETIMLHSLGHSDPCSWTSGLIQMLRQCRNSRKFSIFQCYPTIDNLPKVLTSLCNNMNLTTLRVVIETKVYKSATMISSVGQLLRQCSKLTTLVFVIKSLQEDDSHKLHSALQRIIGKLDRPNFQFEGPDELSQRVSEDAPPLFFPYKWDGFYYP